MKKLLFVLLVSVFFSCKKDKTCNRDMAGISGSYKIVGATYKASASASDQDYYNQIFDVCERDDIFTFGSTGTFTYTDAGVKCVPAGDDTGTWSVFGNDVLIDGFPHTIYNFNCSTLVFVQMDFNVPGDQLRIIFTRQ